MAHDDELPPPPMTYEDIPPAAIPVDLATQVRDRIDADAVDEYAAAMKAGAGFPPVVCFRQDNKLYLAAGHHRVLAARQAKLPTIRVEIMEGNLADAILWGVSDNARQKGLRWRLADKRRAARMILEKLPQMTDSEIADRCGLERHTVGELRKSMWQKLPHCDPTIGVIDRDNGVRIRRDGKPYKIPHRSISADDRIPGASVIDDTYDDDPPPEDPLEAEKPVVKDAVGNVLIHDEHLRAFGETTAEMKEWMNTITKLRAAVKCYHEARDPIMLRLSYFAFRLDTDNLRSLIKFALPYALCPACNGAVTGCGVCQGSGWITTSQSGGTSGKAVTA